MRLLRAVLIAGLAIGATVWSAPVANAACHAFTVSASSPVTEGGNVMVTVSRDGAVADSHVTVSTVDGSATAGSDYTAKTETVMFTGSSTSESLSVPTTNDSAVESDETFKLHLSNPGGCTGSGFSVGPDATVTIKDNDVAPTTPPTTAKPTTTLKATTTTTGRSATTTTTLPTLGTVTSDTTTTSTTLETTTTTDPDDDDSSGAVPLLIGALVVVGAAAVGTAVALRRRQQG